MKIKALFVFILLLTLVYPAMSQSRHWKAADEAFSNMQYNTALTKYKKALSKAKGKPDKEKISFQMAECYRLINNTKKAEAAYKRISKTNYAEKNPVVFLYLAQAMMANEKYEDAKTFFDKYIEQAPDDPRGSNGSESCKLAQEWIENPTKFKIANEKPLNSKEADFSVAYADKLFNTIVFTSSRDAATGKGVDNWTGQSFSDLFVAKLDPKGQWSTPILLETAGTVNTEANEGNPALNAKYNQLYFTRCSNDKGTLQGCRIMVSRRAGRNWGEPTAVELGGDSSTVFGNPSISPDELMLFFSSDLEGGQGGKDLWVATRKSATEKFNKAVNLGNFVNTPGDEMFPFMRNDTTLYFASNGHPGMGGLDIFRSTYSNGKWGKPINMQVPVNSPGDDFSMVFNPEEDKGFFSSNRKGGRGSDDIYSFENPPVLFTLQGIVKDDNTLQVVPGAVIKLIGSDGSSIEAKSDARGIYSFNKAQIKARTSYELICLKNNYFNKKAKETTVGLETSKDFTVDFMLEPIPDKPVVLPDILYDLAKWDLKPQYQDSLQGLIKTLDENETIIVELASHTDSRGSDESNDILSQKRAESVVNYLIERGIDPDRLVAKGYGERVPRRLLKDVSKDGFLFKSGILLTTTYIDSLSTKPMQEAAHALNRRTEFKVLSKDFVPKTQNKAVTSQSQKVNVQINPEDNQVAFLLNPDKSMVFPAIVNGFNLQITLSEEASGLSFSTDQALKLLKEGALGKTDFAGDAAKVLANGSIQDKATFNLAEINIANKSAFDVEATVFQKQKANVLMNEAFLKKFGKFTIDQEKKLIIFQ
ncbi:MAG: OmpA family protein [Bacteroidales bacterium]|nr:OmpA family protein [Bacteroidales bacterium]